MPTPRTIDTYGGTFVDALPVEDATSEQSADYANRLHEDVAQLTRSALKCVVTFPTTTDAAPATVSAASVTCLSQYGTGSSTKPVVAKTAAGVYTLTFAATYDDALSETDPFTITAANASVDAAILGYAQASHSGVVVTVKVYDPASAFAASDLSGSKTIAVMVA